MMKATCLWGHLEGTKPCPRPKDTGKPTDTEIDVVEKWEHEDMVAGYLLSLCLPNSMVLHFSKCCKAHKQWEMVSKEHLA